MRAAITVSTASSRRSPRRNGRRGPSGRAEEAKCADDGDASPPGNPLSEPKYTSLSGGTLDEQGPDETPARWRAEVAATKTMLTRTQESLGLMPRTLAADAAYGSGLMLGWLMGRGVEPHIPLLDHAHQMKDGGTKSGSAVMGRRRTEP
jgi:hypothetical protein